MPDTPALLERTRDDMFVTTDQSRMDVALIHTFLGTESHWAGGIPVETVERAMRNSLCFAAFVGPRQAGFARVVSDYATFAYLCDVFVVAELRGRGLASFLMECVLSHPDLQGLRRFLLVTRDAPWLYTRFGFTPVDNPEQHMAIVNRDIYRRKPE